ncbi:hypothetical protein RM780_11365 [Streptomyces sp. DSM 44917]|uniref:DNA-directed RNA polymerase specialized sigma24 family protein n=1 Tax=Streptomyces boetiae TaxID=3075541 RepID=A0ABU2L7L1_9ACTN|nr:hypothetical protein [Streptomyces sp. DSM 44917]MDT0307559.1 hypothetical protein [Streptomyces sp. DSM 44917]
MSGPGGGGASPPSTEAPGAAPDGVGLGQAEAALIEHYPRLVRLGYLVLPHALGRHRRVLAAHALAQRALPRGKAPEGPPVLPAQRDGEEDPGYAYLRLRVLRAALDAGRPGRLRWLPRTAPRLLPQVVGLRLFPRAGESAELALEQELSALPPAARAAYALRRLDGLEEAAVRGLLAAAGASERQAGAAWRSAAELPLSPELADPCSLQARPTDLLRRRQYARTALFGAAALAVAGGALAALPGGWGPDGPAAPPYAENAAAEAALDPQGLRRIPQDVWRGSARTDFSVWPARGSAVGDTALLRRALAVWARPGPEVSVSATPGTQTGPAPGPAQLLFAGEAGGASVVLLHDGLRLVRYAEPVGGEGAAALDFARVDGADLTGASAVVVGREDGNTRFLTAPWVSEAGVRELTDTGAESAELPVGEDGVTGPVRTPVGVEEAECTGFPVLELTAQGAERPLLLADLGELAPALLTSGAPGDAEPAAASEAWARLACHLPAMAGGGVRSVNAWEFAEQNLPDGAGRAQWVCSRAETWRGVGSRTFAQFLPPPARPGEPAVVTAVAEDATACGPRDPAVLSGVVWRSPARSWYLVAAASEPATGITAHGDVTGETTGRTLTLPAKEGDQPHLTAHRADGGDLPMLG